jgi:hypothetical protein
VGRSSAPPNAPLFAVDESAATIGDQRIDVSAVDAEKTADDIVSRASPGRGVVPVSASRNALIRWVGLVVRELGRTGVEEVDILTPSSRGTASSPLKLSPLGQVPMQEAHCGARITFRSDGTAEFQYMNKAKTKLADGPSGPDVSRALGETRARMKGCGSAVFMFAGEQGAKWGPVFDVGTAVGASELPEGTTTRYIMLL